jgi:4-hydroxy-tetrahydrodipicolinate reductase
MGQEVARVALHDRDVTLKGCLEREGHPCLGRDIGSLVGLGETGVRIVHGAETLSLKTCVAIDFSTPEALTDFLPVATRGCRGVVVGTTGLSEDDRGALSEAAKEHAVLFSPNMSLGVNLLFHLTDEVAKKLSSGFDIEILEAHHRYKKDAPSGTARRLAEIAASARGVAYDTAARHGRSGAVGERRSEEIGVHAVRGGDIVGDHTVLFAGDGERVELRHVAQSRATFARGAVAAAKWLAGRSPGLYSMQDVLGF